MILTLPIWLIWPKDFQTSFSGTFPKQWNSMNSALPSVGFTRSSRALHCSPRLHSAVSAPPVDDDLDHPAWVAGDASAMVLRAYSGLRNEHPKRVVEELLGAAAFPGGEIAKAGPNALTAIIRRLEDSTRIATVAKSALQRRFRACAATYIAWTSAAGEDRASTEAITRCRQASRAFAAEMLAPKDALIDRAPRHGFDSDDLEDIAGEFVCPYPTVMWQAHRAGIALRGVELPFVDRMRII